MWYTIFTYFTNTITFHNPPEILNKKDNKILASGSSINLNNSKYFFNVLNGAGSRFDITLFEENNKLSVDYDSEDSNSCKKN